MTTTHRQDATRALADLDIDLDAAALADEIEAWLADPNRTAHPLVTLPTHELVRQALDSAPTPKPDPKQPPESPLRGLWRILPDRALTLRRPRGPVDCHHISVVEHLQLTAAILQHSGWARTGHRHRTATGRRCILGAQRALAALGYGDRHTTEAAAAHLNQALRARRVRAEYPDWNETATLDQVLNLIDDAITLAGGHR